MRTFRKYAGSLRTRLWLAKAVAVALFVCVQIPASGQEPAGEMPRLQVTAGRSIVLTTEFDVTRVAITNPEVADAIVVQPREILIDGKTPGTISFILWGPAQRVQYDLVVEAPIPGLQQHLGQLFPGEDIRVNVAGDAVVLSGNVSSNAVMLRAAEIATATGAANVINMLQLPGGTESEQVILQVRFAEVNRRAINELGLGGLFMARDRFLGRATTQQFPSPNFDLQDGRNELVFSDFLNIFFLDQREGIGAVIRALNQRGAFQSLAEPNLIAYNGREASFLAGGEFPVPVVQGTSGAVSVQFREFGVRLNFTPTIAGDVIRLRVAPEVSALDFANGVSLGGFRIPALTTRRAETEVELRDGQSFAIAGLLDNIAQDDSAAIPILSRLPIIGNLFKTKADRAERTELMVLVTPRLVRPLDPDEVPPLPTTPDMFLPREELGDQLQGAGTVDAPPGNQQ
ncbi:MAG: type II and III secretion system protein family protein [Vicinamibacterales bacterium]